MFDTPFDRNAAEAAEERRDQQASELLDDGSAEETTVSEKGTALQRPRRLWLALAALFALVELLLLAALCRCFVMVPVEGGIEHTLFPDLVMPHDIAFESAAFEIELAIIPGSGVHISSRVTDGSRPDQQSVPISM